MLFPLNSLICVLTVRWLKPALGQYIAMYQNRHNFVTEYGWTNVLLCVFQEKNNCKSSEVRCFIEVDVVKGFVCRNRKHSPRSDVSIKERNQTSKEELRLWLWL